MVLEIQVSCSVEVHLWKKKHQVGGSFLSISGSATLSQAGILKGGLPLESQECMNPEMLMSLMLDVSQGSRVLIAFQVTLIGIHCSHLVRICSNSLLADINYMIENICFIS